MASHRAQIHFSGGQIDLLIGWQSEKIAAQKVGEMTALTGEIRPFDAADGVSADANAVIRQTPEIETKDQPPCYARHIQLLTLRCHRLPTAGQLSKLTY